MSANCGVSPTKSAPAALKQYTAIWHVDFEYREDANHHPVPVCMFAYEQRAGTEIQLWQDELQACRQAPFDIGPDVLFVAYAASAELSCFLALGWPFPKNVLDAYVETIAAINGNTLIWPAKKRPGPLSALELYGLPAAMDTEEKERMRRLFARPYSRANATSLSRKRDNGTRKYSLFSMSLFFVLCSRLVKNGD